jgi:deoxyadenosine/deoxycytidine kinase
MRIGIIGPNGVGKSTLSEKLSEYYESPLVEEPVVANPYLPYFYEDKLTFSFPAQMAFYSALFLEMWKAKDKPLCIYDSTLLSNLVYTELLLLEGFMTEKEKNITYDVAEAYMSRLPKLDITIILQRPKDQLFKNVERRGREIEKDQRDYLNFHYDHHDAVMNKIITHFNIPSKHILYLTLGDMFEEKEFKRILRLIEDAYARSQED